ncbi:hypothetical protein KRE40_07815 [Elizabethkingia meningoseptica]|uniref:hypothetical protein n=1 Tax=Elizabethkingia meningoseptica TaxID=238 RepID=UPI00099A5587|nr:hypothetical protein [Elizabethkingia meningoseptica]MDE5438012.1 hypothetical protein [Elizabethkingia meningoseptica]MDE5492142.1 hypothetical protein [Elizabethkingia meningoseptica]MDE5508555.1 hypothetical protein [Elizabethkingia meningoseptica]MDE5516085.1 hypothetical protein [Elizabethkingia meningoseptica]MDE5526938.1 hypothetical protein [Elizabethkingia meningoseptica]
MNIKKIINKLSEEGYSPYLQEKLGIIFNSIDDDKGNPRVDSVSQIRIEKEKIIIQYPLGQIPVEKEFKTVEELLKFVRQVFPIEE